MSLLETCIVNFAVAANGRATVWQAVAISGTTQSRVHIQYSPTRVIQVFINDYEIDYDVEPETLKSNGESKVMYSTACVNGMALLVSRQTPDYKTGFLVDLTITRKSNTSTVEVILDSGVAVEVTSSEGILDLVIYLPYSARGHYYVTKFITPSAFRIKVKQQSHANFPGMSTGLFGSWDDNVSNDLITPAGQSYQCNDTAQELFEFGNTCRIAYRSGHTPFCC